MKRYFFYYHLSFWLVFGLGCDVANNNEKPSCTFESPSNNSTVEKGENVSIWVNASDPDGSVSKINLFINSNNVSSTTISPLTFQWDTSSEDIGTYTIRAQVIDNEGAESSTEITLNIDPVSLPVPTNFVILRTEENTIILDWETVFEAESYNLFWTDNGTDPTTSSNKINSLGAYYEHTGLSYENTYTYRVQSVKGEFTSDLSDPVSGSPELPALAKAGNVYTVENPNSIDIYWDAIDYEGVTYSIEKRNSIYGSYSTLVTGLSSLSFEDTEIELGKGYFYRVVGYDATNDRTSEADPVQGFTSKTIDETERNNQDISNSLNYDTHYYSAEDVTYELDKFVLKGGYTGTYSIYSAASYKNYEADCFNLYVESGDIIQFKLISGQMTDMWSMDVSVREFGKYTNGNDYDAELHLYDNSVETWPFEPTSGINLTGVYLEISMWEDLINYGPYNYEIEITIIREP